MAGHWDAIKKIHADTTRGAKEGLAFKYFSRPLASLMLYKLQHTSITPNQITILSLIVGIAGSAAHMFWLSWGGLLAGSALFMLAHVLDALDGQLARHRNAGSVVGMHFDFFIDEIKAYLMYLALGIRLYWQTLIPGAGQMPEGTVWGNPTLLLDPLTERWGAIWILYWILLGLLALAIGLSCTQFFKRQEWKKAFPPKEIGSDSATGSNLSPAVLIEKVGHFVVDYPSYIVPLCLINRVDVYLVLYTLVVVAYAARALLQMSVALWRVNPYN